jgi:hypothetical protein
MIRGISTTSLLNKSIGIRSSQKLIAPDHQRANRENPGRFFCANRLISV